MAMHDELPFRIIFAGIYVAGFLMRGLFIQRMKPQEKPIIPEAGNAGEISRFRVIFQKVMFFLWIAIVASYTWYPPWVEALHFPFPTWLRYGGAIAAAVSFLFLFLTMKTLGRYWSPLPRLMEGHKLVITGPYRFIRHPMYTAMMLLFIAFILITANAAVTVFSLIATVLTVKWALNEEKMLIGFFGDEYRAYMTRTGAFLPAPRKMVRHIFFNQHEKL
ncbi:Isoprenylcysteine carboxyl methyltransferase [Chlorobium phaeobacteroides DSM 266]|uniref:Isoprenylcysteine carboxyl methyltransferase n=1 Tax=Chlorobium phaeobacteroides (strain DSM 266 / SMG 266 / 2430) TaxID=290317 RepID=A1BCX6_CHLPD|nr:Isoprenylcysteine carboxyl methyltransferase [Chlorobium phaeobacteroides DSM 266]MBV5327991.1 isoprenylcysteine carboxylmethyltransferase family protein [Chlorobium sp.]